jgi:hypothetical protein
MDYATELFMKMYEYEKKDLLDRLKLNSWKQLVTVQLRHVMDFYTAARIIKSHMKHIIVYGGDIHTRYLFSILRSLNFDTMKTIKGSKKCSDVDINELMDYMMKKNRLKYIGNS